MTMYVSVENMRKKVTVGLCRVQSISPSRQTEIDVMFFVFATQFDTTSTVHPSLTGTSLQTRTIARSVNPHHAGSQLSSREAAREGQGLSVSGGKGLSPCGVNGPGPPIGNTAETRACRLTGAATFTGVGAYALYQGRAQGALKKVRPAGAPIINGQISLVLGVGEFSAWTIRAAGLGDSWCAC